MATFSNPEAKPGTVHMIRGVRFTDGRSEDVQVSDDTRTVFAMYGIREDAEQTEPDTGEAEPDTGEAEPNKETPEQDTKPAPARPATRRKE